MWPRARLACLGDDAARPVPSQRPLHNAASSAVGAALIGPFPRTSVSLDRSRTGTKYDEGLLPHSGRQRCLFPGRVGMIASLRLTPGPEARMCDKVYISHRGESLLDLGFLDILSSSLCCAQSSFCCKSELVQAICTSKSRGCQQSEGSGPAPCPTPFSWTTSPIFLVRPSTPQRICKDSRVEH
ncbi:hypothetical protein BGZ61DRAFT_196008 [Ilyonectria robusta]|uniref:uncharacterized protein n=1 Tax=Ilyonectria robusta TaxID=1079257 RepID=UPI001E8EBD64|nr:uncharacterized protein BGZ61DRAFT_196008 [Ilyonectria robusta]KAH8721873.1 hypothetical protein BGZ61DRAFT_196008 [Ilyonectria robusta]